MKKWNYQEKGDSSAKNPQSFKKNNLFESDDGKETVEKYFFYFLTKILRRYSRYTTKGAVFADKVNRISGDLLGILEFVEKIGQKIDKNQ